MIEEVSEGNADNLYELLIHYKSQFMNHLKHSQKFYNLFIKNARKTELEKKIRK